MEQLEKQWNWKKWLKKLWTSLALVWLLLTQNPQTTQAQTDQDQLINTEEVLNDSCLSGDFKPEFIQTIWNWENNRFVIDKNYIRKDSLNKSYITLNWNNYYNVDELFLEDYSWLWYLHLWVISSNPNWFFIGTVKDGNMGNNWILILKNWSNYQWSFSDELYEWYWTLKFSDWKQYEWNFHEWKIDGKWTMTWPNWEYYEWEFQDWKRHWEWTMHEKYHSKYEWTWEKDNPIKDPRHNWNPLIIWKGTYTYYWENKAIYEISNSSRPEFISSEDKKIEENWNDKRWNIVYIKKIFDWKETYELFSWSRTTKYSLDEENFVFSTQDWAELKFPKKIWEEKAKAIANLINSVMTLVKKNDEWYSFYAFDYQKNTLQAQYRWKIFDVNLVKDIPWKIGISAKEFSNWLNHYRLDKPYWAL